MPTSGDIVDLDLGLPEGRETGFRHPAVLVTAQGVLDHAPSVVHIVPLTSNVRGLNSEVTIVPDLENGLAQLSAGQCQHLRGISLSRVAQTRGNVGPAVLAQLRETIAVLLDLPG